VNTILHNLLATGIKIGGGIVGTKLVSGGWKLATGHSAPKDATDETLPIVEALAFAFVSAGIGALLKVAGQRGAGKAIGKIEAKTGRNIDNEV